MDVAREVAGAPNGLSALAQVLATVSRSTTTSNVNADVEQHIATASMEQIDTWAERVLSAATLTELLAD